MAEDVLFDDVLRYVRWSEGDEAALRALAPRVASERRALVEEFYDRLREHPEAEAVLRDEAQVRRLRDSLERWLDELLSAPRDRAYFEQRRRTGVVHARVGLPQRYVFMAMALLRTRLERIASSAFAADEEAAARAREALGKALDVELAVLAECYLNEARGAERWANQAERLAAAGALTAGFAHEIRNPLNIASLNVQLLERSLRSIDGLPPLAAEALDVLRGELERIARLASDFLDFARPRPLRFDGLDLGEIVQRAVELAASDAEASGVELVYERPTHLLYARADEGALKRVLDNLLRNAFEASSGTAQARVVVRARGVGRFLEVDVEDTGPGFPPSAPVFDAFYTTKVKGAGLGLAVVHRLVDGHGGAVSASGGPGCMLFTVRLPRDPPGA